MASIQRIVLLLCLVSASSAFEWCKIFNPGSECAEKCPKGFIDHVAVSTRPAYCNNGEVCCDFSKGEVNIIEETTELPFIIDSNTCGVLSGRSRRSVGGVPTRRCSWPWLASVRVTTPFFSSSHAFNAVLIDKQHLLVNSNVYKAFSQLPDLSLEAYLGEYNLSMEGDEVDTIPIVNTATTVQDDVTILKMSREVFVESCIRPICTGNSSIMEEKVDLKACKMVGWGNIESGSGETALSPVPLVQNIRYHDPKSCRLISSLTPGVTYSDDLLCLIFDEGNMATEEDIGSPIMCPNERNQWYLKGMLSRANYDATTSDVTSYATAIDIPAIFNRIQAALQRF